MIIPNFSGGLITNAGDHAARNRENFANYARECRSDAQGWLIRRDGRIKLSDDTGFTDVFTHKTVILAVIDGNLKWARTQTIGEQLQFNDLRDQIKEEGERVVFHRRDDLVYLSTGKTSYVVNVPDPPDEPTLTPFRLEETPDNTYTIAVQHGVGGSVSTWIDFVDAEYEGIADNPREVGNYTYQPNRDTFREKRAGAGRELVADVTAADVLPEDYVWLGENDTEADAVADIQGFDIDKSYVSYISGLNKIRVLDSIPNTEDIDSGEKVGIYAQAVILNDEGERQLVAPISDKIAELRVRDADENEVLTEVDITINRVDDDIEATHIIFFSTRPKDNAPDTIGGDRLLSVTLPVAYQVGNTARFAYSDRFDTDTGDYVDAGEPVDFQHIAINKFRTYIANDDKNEIYLSYYDPETLTQLYQNFTDVISVELGSGKITGLNFIRDNILVIYGTNQIQLMTTDPIAELHRIIDGLGPEDDAGNPIGCIAPDSLVDMGGVHYFLASNGYVHRFDNRSIPSISDPVQAIFHTVSESYDMYGQKREVRAVGFAHDRHYFISIPSVLETPDNDEPNTTLLYSMQYGRWWQDGFGIEAITAGSGQRLYGIVDGQLFELYQGDDDAGEEIERIWRSNPELRKSYDLLECVNVFCQGSAEIEVKATTEEGSEVTHLSVEDGFIFDDQRAGFYLHGRTHTVELKIKGDAAIDRLATNERISA